MDAIVHIADLGAAQQMAHQPTGPPSAPVDRPALRSISRELNLNALDLGDLSLLPSMQNGSGVSRLNMHCCSLRAVTSQRRK